ncbi:MAG: hypothetical protein ACK47D_13570, partial [Pseudanabaena sp.]
LLGMFLGWRHFQRINEARKKAERILRQSEEKYRRLHESMVDAFVSVSKQGDGRAPEGKATIIASEFTNLEIWDGDDDYFMLKQKFTERAIAQLSAYFHLNEQTIIHIESATPQTFERYTGRDRGIVGGVGMRVSTFGPFGFANRTPLKNIWLVGDSTHPGEGTAGVSYSALTVVRQIVQLQ